MFDTRSPFALEASGLLDDTTEPAFDDVTEQARAMLHTSCVVLSLAGPEGCVVKSQAGTPVHDVPGVHALCRRIVRSGEAVLEGDVGLQRVGAFAGLPVRGSDGHVFGCLAAVEDHERPWTDADQAILAAWSATATAAIELRLSRFVAGRALSLAEGQSAILRHIAEGYALADALEEIVDHVERHAKATVGSVLLVSKDGRHLVHGAGASLPQAYRDAIDGSPIGDGAGSCGTAAYIGELVVVSDIATDPRWADYRHLAAAHDLRACWSKPVLAADGRVLGTFAFYYHDVRRPSPEELALIDDAAALAGIAIERELTQRALVEGATRDPLTGLWNRRVMLEQLNRRRTPTEELAVVYFIDIDHFKRVNDELGHQAGDELLQAIARRLERITRDGDVLTRLGGDELALFARGVGARGEAEAFAHRLLRSLELPFELSMASVQVRVSVGVAIAKPETSGEELLSAADHAMYRVKSAGGNGFAVHEDPHLRSGRLNLA
jgi:diguanylate cyclase (GGDEF)-like protein